MRPGHKLPVLFAFLAVLGCFAFETPERSIAADVQELAPPSELALLMRAMAAHADSVKAAIARDAKLPPYPSEIKALFTATPTKDMHIDPISYPAFGKDYQIKVDLLYKAAKKDRSRAYNALVQSCANCHGTHCPGPLMRIKKMYVQLPE